ncbi:hypothetical protein Tsubulata_003205 [Turnera subulata]|uniref:DUF4408 domain-containing protein n=1 Tax=Turnera subulata TaxID=218843 RepID=A0A9Q0JQ47_9ROSI|nr:hypothetical protein Tsubulata_003205 [Turnera subulata]
MLALITSWLTPASLFLFLNLMIGTIVVVSRFGSQTRQHHQLNSHPPPLTRQPSLLDRVKSINFYTHGYQAEPDHSSSWADPPPLERAPSLLQRLKSVNFSTFYGSEPETKFAPEPDFGTGYVTSGSEPPGLQRAPSLLQRVRSIKFSSLYKSEPEMEPVAEPGFDAAHGSGANVEHHEVRRIKSEHMEAPKKMGKMKKSASEKGVAVDSVEQEEREEVEQRRPATARVERTASIGDDGVDAKADDFINRFKQQLKLQRLDSLLRYKEMLHGKQKI